MNRQVNLAVIQMLQQPQFPTIPIWSNRWTVNGSYSHRRLGPYRFQLFRFEVIGERGAVGLGGALLMWGWFPTIPIWSNRWTSHGISRTHLIKPTSFQLFRFEVIGERMGWGFGVLLQYFRFQLFRFEVIGELTPCRSHTRHRFQTAKLRRVFSLSLM